VILAGGQASRFGGIPKGLQPIGGIRILDRLVETFRTAFGHLPLLVANDPAAGSWRPDLQVVPDLQPGLGALGGLYTAVMVGPAPVLVAGWDMPFLTPALLRAIGAGLKGADACLPAGGGQFGIEPLAAAYGPGCAGPMRDALAAGDLRAVGFHPRVKVSILSPDEVARFGDPTRLFFNVNTAADLLQAESLWRKPESSR
jgi:molybdopterin-guanine dinucleotide biosynthesis protein A